MYVYIHICVQFTFQSKVIKRKMWCNKIKNNTYFMSYNWKCNYFSEFKCAYLYSIFKQANISDTCTTGTTKKEKKFHFQRKTYEFDFVIIWITVCYYTTFFGDHKVGSEFLKELTISLVIERGRKCQIPSWVRRRKAWLSATFSSFKSNFKGRNILIYFSFLVIQGYS